MGAVRGEGGSLQFGVTPSQVGLVKTWTFTPAKGEIDITCLGDLSTKVMGSIVSGSFTADVFYDPSASGTTAALLKQVFQTSDDADAIVRLYVTSSKYIAFSGLVTGGGIDGVTPGSPIMVKISGSSNGTINVANF
jgi:hypothetical protein